MILALPTVRYDARRVCGAAEGRQLIAGLPKDEARMVGTALRVCGVLPCPRPKAADLTGPLSAARGKTQLDREHLARTNRDMRAAAAELARALGPLPARSPVQVAYLWIDNSYDTPTLEAYTVDEGTTCRIPLPQG